MTSQDRADGAERGAGAWRMAALALSQIGLLTAVLYYFGWARTSATFGYFGVDVSLLGFSTADFVLRSANAAFGPLAALGGVAVAAVILDAALSSVTGVARRPVLRRVPPALLVAGGAFVATGAAGMEVPGLDGSVRVWLPALMALGFVLLRYAARMWPLLRAPAAQGFAGSSGTTQTMMLLLAVLALFWTVSLYAVQVGHERARRFAANLPDHAEVVVLAKDRLAIGGPGVRVTTLRSRASRYRVRYTGLRLLSPSRDGYFLLPYGWRRGVDSVFAIPDDADVRIDLIAG